MSSLHILCGVLSLVIDSGACRVNFQAGNCRQTDLFRSDHKDETCNKEELEINSWGLHEAFNDIK